MPSFSADAPRAGQARHVGGRRVLAASLLAALMTGAPAFASAASAAIAAPVSAALVAGIGTSHTYTPSVGEPLARIVAKTLPNSPLNAELLAQAFVSLNPQAFSAGANSRTLSATTLKVPNHNQLVHRVLAKTEAERPVALAALESKIAAAAAPRPQEKRDDKRENWVRYAGTSIKAALNFDGSADERKNWVHYLSAAVNRALGGSAPRAETLQWVQYPRITPVLAAVAGGPLPAATLPGAPEAATDTRNWVRYSAGRSHPTQQFAQLFD